MEKTVLSVSELNQAAQKLLEGHFQRVWVEGEISNLSKPSSGHIYFSLKDPKAQIRCALFRMHAKGINFELKNGLLVQALAKVSLYPDRGDYQLIVESMELAGDGLLRLAYEKLLKKLKEEGLFAENLKKPLPKIPKHIGVITSPTGAAIRDVLTVLKRRFPAIPVSIYPSKVQGNLAAPEIVEALTRANNQALCDVLILARGGGSLEDLWPFNEEIVARAIAASKIPIVSGVGHEIDFTIADFVADKRAATPSQAAELVSPNQTELFKQFKLFENRIYQQMLSLLQNRSQHLDHLLKRLKHPGQIIRAQFEHLVLLKKRIHMCIQQILKAKRAEWQGAMRALDTISPLATLKRGYAIATKLSTNKILSSVTEVKSSDRLKIKVSDGELDCVVS